jgi:hypothetical protein
MFFLNVPVMIQFSTIECKSTNNSEIFKYYWQGFCKILEYLSISRKSDGKEEARARAACKT